jgi:hypothetical protein
MDVCLCLSDLFCPVSLQVSSRVDPLTKESSNCGAKAVPLHATKALGGERYGSYSFSTTALDGGEWSASRPGRALAPGKGPPVPIVQEAGWASEPVWIQRLQEKSFASAMDRTSIVQP